MAQGIGELKQKIIADPSKGGRLDCRWEIPYKRRASMRRPKS